MIEAKWMGLEYFAQLTDGKGQAYDDTIGLTLKGRVRADQIMAIRDCDCRHVGMPGSRVVFAGGLELHGPWTVGRVESEIDMALKGAS